MPSFASLVGDHGSQPRVLRGQEAEDAARAHAALVKRLFGVEVSRAS